MLAQARRWSARSFAGDAAALALLAGLALAACGFLLRDDLFIFGDHPGQFMRLWVPTHLTFRLLGWNPTWYAGYPELQFYPPGFVLFGWLLYALSLGQLSAFAHYQLLLFLAYLLPGLSVYALLRGVTGRHLPGLFGGILALVFPEMWGGTAAVFVGLVAERLAFGLVPLAMFAGWQVLHGTNPRRWWPLTALLLAATILMHPFHAVAPLLFLGASWLLGPRRRSRLRDLGLAGLLALLLAAFWLLPLVAHQGYAAPMLRADLAQTLDWLLGTEVWPYLAAGLLLPLVLRPGQGRRVAPFALAVAATGVLLLVLILVDHLLLIQVLGFYLLDPVRFSAEFYLAAVLLAGLGLAYVPVWLVARLGRAPGILATGLILVLAAWWLAPPFWDQVRGQRDPSHFLRAARQEYDLDPAWQALASGGGRILFTSHYLHLDGLPTALKAATPYFTGRDILGGTFSHWSPVARLLWTGGTAVDLLPGQVELNDDVSLAGRPWRQWTGAEFYDLCRRLDATTVAATWADVNARTFLDGAPQFQSFYSDDLFVLYRVLGLEPSPVEVRGRATVAVVRREPAALDLAVEGATAGDNLTVKITDYPLWRVEAAGQRLPHRAGPLGLMTFDLPPGSYDLHLRYLPGPAENAGAWLSLLAAVACLAVLFTSYLPRPHSPQP